MFSFSQKSWEVVKNIRFHSVNMTCQSIIVFKIPARNVQFLPEILGSGQKHKAFFGKYDMSINSRVLVFLLEMLSFCQKSWEAIKNIRFLSVKMTCRSILVFGISSRKVQFLP